MSWSLNVRVHGVRRRIALGKGLNSQRRDGRPSRRARRSRAARTRPKRIRRLTDRRKAAASGHRHTEERDRGILSKQGRERRCARESRMRTMIERVFADHLSRPALDVRSAELQLTVDAWRSKSSAQHAAAYFRPRDALGSQAGAYGERRSAGSPAASSSEPTGADPRRGRATVGNLGWGAHDAAARFMLLTGARCEEVVRGDMGGDRSRSAQWTIPARGERIRGQARGGPRRITSSR